MHLVSPYLESEKANVFRVPNLSTAERVREDLDAHYDRVTGPTQSFSKEGGWLIFAWEPRV